MNVYILEAHPVDGWQLPDNEPDEDDVCFAQPRTLDERMAVATAMRDRLGVGSPLVVDGVDNACELAYEARPERLYVIQDGVVVFRTGPGPFCYSPAQLRAFLKDGTPAKA